MTYDCDIGKHEWKIEGTRKCPDDDLRLTDYCSQPIYVCVNCGTYDCGERGGPGYSDCVNRICFRMI